MVVLALVMKGRAAAVPAPPSSARPPPATTAVLIRSRRLIVDSGGPISVPGSARSTRFSDLSASLIVPPPVELRFDGSTTGTWCLSLRLVVGESAFDRSARQAADELPLEDDEHKQHRDRQQR